MSRDRQSSRPDLQQAAHIATDARVEVILFLGFVFWGWLLVVFFQGTNSLSPPDAMLLYWDGADLQMGTAEAAVAAGQNEQTGIMPPALSPLLFLPIPVNFADEELLATISGIGPKMAGQIVTTREAKGLFARPQDLLAVPGIGPSRMKTFAAHLSFSLSP